MKDKDLDALTAKGYASAIAFSPLTFHAVKAMMDLGLLGLIEKAGDEGITPQELSNSSGVSLYGVTVLTQMAVRMKVLLKKGDRLTLGKVGFMLLNDAECKVNFNFTADVCYAGAQYMTGAIKEGRPEGLKVFSPYNTIYEALSLLPPTALKSWLAFDHHYSDGGFKACLPFIKEEHIADVGGNTGRFASLLASINKRVTIVDLPGQIAMAKESLSSLSPSVKNLIAFYPCNVLKDPLPAAPTYWMSQFLDCFSTKEITLIFEKIYKANKAATVYVLEPLLDHQRYEAAAYCLAATSLYFTTMANGNSKMYEEAELSAAIEAAGYSLREVHHNLGSNCYSLLVYKAC